MNGGTFTLIYVNVIYVGMYVYVSVCLSFSEGKSDVSIERREGSQKLGFVYI